MKIAIVCPYPLHTAGGVQRHILDYYQQLKKRGHYVKLVSPSDQMEMEDHITLGVFYEVNGGKIIANGSRTYYTRTQFGKSKLPEVFDVIHVHEPLHPAFFYGLTIARHNTAKKVAHIHAYNPFLTESLKLISIPILNSIIRNFDHVIATSKVSGAPYMGSGVPVTIVPNGVETTKLGPDFAKLPEYMDGKKNVMFLGRADERKGLKYMLQAWPALYEHFKGNVRLIVAGGRSKEEVDLMTSWADGLVGRDQIIFEGGVSEERKTQLFVTSDVYVSPATGGESFGMVLNESMACGTPVVAFDNPGYRLVLSEKAEYCLAELLNVEDLTNKTIRIIEDAAVKNELREWGLREVREKYDWALITNQILAIYEGLLEQEASINSAVANK